MYWLPLYGVLEAAGLDVRMVNGRQTRYAPGRKSDMQDAQWGAALHMHCLLALCDVQIRRANAEHVMETLRGTWSDEHIFALEQALQSWDHYQRLIADCDRRIQAVLPPYDPTLPALAGPAKRGGVNAPEIGMLREILAKMCSGRDLTRLPAHKIGRAHV